MGKEFLMDVPTATWIMSVIGIVDMFYGEIPFSDLYKVFQSGSAKNPAIVGVDEDAFRGMLSTFIEVASQTNMEDVPPNIRMEGDMVISNCFGVENYPDLDYIRAEREKRKELGCYILSFDEATQIATKGHIDSREYDDLVVFFKSAFNMTGEDADEVARHAVYTFWCTGEMTTGMNETIRELGRVVGRKFTMPLPDYIKMTNLVFALYKVTGQADMYGWSPCGAWKKIHGTDAPDVTIGNDGMMTGRPAVDPCQMTIVPGSTKVAKEIKENKALMDAMGLHSDLNTTAGYASSTVMSPEGTPMIGSRRKVYRNDPCPCGSGKKYKRCCGLNRSEAV